MFLFVWITKFIAKFLCKYNAQKKEKEIRTPLISFCTVQLRTLCAAHSLATLCLFTISGPDPGELPGFWDSMVSHHAPIPQKGSGKQQQQQQKEMQRKPLKQARKASFILLLFQNQNRTQTFKIGTQTAHEFQFL